MHSGAMEESPSFLKSKPILSKPEPISAKPSQPISQRPPAAGPLGGKLAECFIWSADHDDDAEFLRRYAGSPERILFMLTWHAEDSATFAARVRLSNLTKPKT